MKKNNVYVITTEEGYEQFKNDVINTAKEVVEEEFGGNKLYRMLITSPSFIDNLLFELEDVVDELQSNGEPYNLHDEIFKEMAFLIGLAVLSVYSDHKTDHQ